MLSGPLQESNCECTILPQKNFLGATSSKKCLNRLKEWYEHDPLLNHPPKDSNLKYDNRFWTQTHCLYVPESVWVEALRLVHDSKLAGHSEISKTKELLSSFWWPGYKKDVKSYVALCLTCARNKTP